MGGTPPSARLAVLENSVVVAAPDVPVVVGRKTARTAARHRRIRR
jgi:hypothetical protein